MTGSSISAGSLNNKYAPPRRVRIIHEDKSAFFSFADLGRYRRVSAISHVSSPPISEGAVNEATPLSPRITELIKTGRTPAHKYKTRSEADAAVVAAMVRAGYTDDAIIATFTDPNNGISSKTLQKGADGRRYLDATIRKARAWAAELAVNGHPYRETNDGLVRLTENGESILLTNFTARIVAQTHEDNGLETVRTLEVEATFEGRPARVILTPDEFDAMRWPIAKVNPKAFVYPGGNVLREHARTAIQQLSGPVSTRQVFAHTGWRKLEGTWVYLHAGGAIGAAGLLPDVHVNLPDRLSHFRLPVPADSAGAARASLDLLNGVAPDAIMFPLVAAVYRAILGDTDFSIHITGDTGAHKTGLAALVQQHFGPGFVPENLGSWEGTANSLEQLCFIAKDAIHVVDDFVPAGSVTGAQKMQEKAARLFRAQGNRAGRSRLSADLQQRPTYPPRGLLLSTGEDVPRGQSIRARMLILELLKGAVDTAKLTAAQRSAEQGLYAQAAAGFTQWAAGQYESLQRDKREAIRGARASQPNQPVHQRSVDLLASLAWGLAVFLRYAVDAGAITQAEADTYETRARAALEKTTDTQRDQQQEASLADRYVELLRTVIIMRRAHLTDERGFPPIDMEGRRTPQIGWRKEGDVFVQPQAAFAEVQALARTMGDPLPVSEAVMRRLLKEQKLLVSVDSKRGTICVRRHFEGKYHNVLHFSVRTIFETEPADDQHDEQATEKGETR